jgi:molybdate transport system ATP-binding protein
MATTLEKAQAQKADPHAAADGLEVRVKAKVSSGMGVFTLDVQWSMAPGISILFGPSGAGKTTLLDLIAGLRTPDEGRILAGGRLLFDSERGINMPARERRIGYVFQDLALFPHLNVAANVAYGLRVERSERERRVGATLESLGLVRLATRLPAELSGGERQRVALARALVTEPCMLLLDEPLAALDLPVRTRIADDLRRSVQQLPIPVLYVTHSRDEVFMLGDGMFVLERGRTVQQGTPHQVFSAPRTEIVAQLAGFENLFDVEVAAIHEERGTMTCRPLRSRIELETPLVRAEVGAKLRIGISAGDVLLSTVAPIGLSARNALPGRLVSLAQRDMIVVARVDCGLDIAVHLTLAARDALALVPGAPVWLIVKTHSCHVLEA